MNDDPLYTLGGVTFSAKNRPLDSLQSKSDYTWAIMERIGAENTIQPMGFANKEITLVGVTFPMLGNANGSPAGVHQIRELETLQAEGVPYPLVDGNGTSLGLWAITSIQDEKTSFIKGGGYLSGTFSVSLIRYVSDNVGGDGAISSGGFDLSKWREGIQSFIGSLSNIFK